MRFEKWKNSKETDTLKTPNSMSFFLLVLLDGVFVGVNFAPNVQLKKFHSSHSPVSDDPFEQNQG
jgi:hypothetical protein